MVRWWNWSLEEEEQNDDIDWEVLIDEGDSYGSIESVCWDGVEV